MAEIKLGDIYFAKLPDKDKAQRGIQSGVRPVVVFLIIKVTDFHQRLS